MRESLGAALEEPTLPPVNLRTAFRVEAAPDEWKLAQRITESRGFRKSELLERFLLEVSELALVGRRATTPERTILYAAMRACCTRGWRHTLPKKASTSRCD